jgi:MazG family protein
MATERGAFGIEDVIETLCAKLVRRHPHVFGNESVSTSEQVVENWARIKAREKADARVPEAGESRSALDGVPRALPALLRAHRLGRKAADVRFDWDSSAGVRQKLAEEITELDAALANDDLDAASSELGDVLFTAASLARKLGRNAEDLLHGALARFEQRFRDMERDFADRGVDMARAIAQDLEQAWQRAKERERRRS